MSSESHVCSIEEMSRKSKLPFVSVKNNCSPEELVLNPRCYKSLEDEYKKSFFQKSDLSDLEKVKNICRSCRKCIPTIYEESDAKAEIDGKIRHGIRILRNEYSHEEVVSESGLYVVEKFFMNGEPLNGNGKRPKICFVDDTDNMWPHMFTNTNMNILNILINPDVPCGPSRFTQLVNEIINWNPDILISDKGTGFVDGIELIRRCKEQEIRTIMLTGEIQTRETKMVADIFLEKPIGINKLKNTIKELLV